MWITPHKNWYCGLVSGCEQNFGSQEDYKPRKSDILANGVIILKFGEKGDITDIITDVEFRVNRFRDFGAVMPSNLANSIWLAGDSHNSVSVAMLHCNVAYCCEAVWHNVMHRCLTQLIVNVSNVAYCICSKTKFSEVKDKKKTKAE